MLNKKMRVLGYWLPVVFCSGCIFYFSSLPGTQIPRLFSFQEVLFHFSIYFILGLFFSRALDGTFSGMLGIKILIFTFIFVGFYGITDEFHQFFIPDRNVSVFDVFIDAFGGLFGGLFLLRHK